MDMATGHYGSTNKWLLIERYLFWFVMLFLWNSFATVVVGRKILLQPAEFCLGAPDQRWVICMKKVINNHLFYYTFLTANNVAHLFIQIYIGLDYRLILLRKCKLFRLDNCSILTVYWCALSAWYIYRTCLR